MPLELSAWCFAANDPLRLAQFWGGVLRREVLDEGHDGIALLSGDPTEFRIRFLVTADEKIGPNRMHFDLTSVSLEDQQETVERALALGARHLDVGQGPEETHVVLADPEGNEFCVIEPGNSFLAGCGLVGALTCDGSQEVGYFWSQALGWPLVWDQDEETAIQSPVGGAKIAWGGPPVAPKSGRNRMHPDVTPPADGGHQAEVDRLVALGAALTAPRGGTTGRVEMTDIDGNEFCVLITG
jgi:hypothetical protein